MVTVMKAMVSAGRGIEARRLPLHWCVGGQFDRENASASGGM